MVLSITASPGGGSIGFGRRSINEAMALAKHLVAEGYRKVVVTDLTSQEVVWQQDEPVAKPSAA